MRKSNLHQWLSQGTEDHDESPTIVQDGTTPKDGFGDSTGTLTDEDERSDPATAELDPPATGEDDHKTTDQGHQTVISSESEAGTQVEKGGKSNEETGEENEVDVEGNVDTVTDKATSADLSEEGDVGELEEVPESDDKTHPEATDTRTNEVNSSEHHGDAEPTGSEVPSGQAPQNLEGGTGEMPDHEPVIEGPDVTEQVDTPTLAHVDETDVTAGTQAAMDQVANDIDHFQDMSATLEAYADLLTQSLANDGHGVPASTGEAIRIGLERFQEDLGDQELIASTETFGQTASTYTATRVSLESVKETLGQVAEAAKRAIKRLFELLHEMWAKATNGLKRITKRREQLENRLKAIKASNVSEQTSIGGAARLRVESDFVGNDVQGLKDLRRVASFMFVDYPKQVKNYAYSLSFSANTLAKLVENVPEDITEKVTKTLHDDIKNAHKYFEPLPGAAEVSKSRVKTKYQDYPVLKRSVILPGNKMLLQGLSGGDDDAAAHFAKRKILLFRLEDNHSNNNLESKETYMVPSKRDMESILGEVGGVLSVMEKHSRISQDYKRAKDSIDATIGSVEKQSKRYNEAYNETLGSAPGSSANKVYDLNSGVNIGNWRAGPEIMVARARNASQAMTQPPGHFFGYALRTLQAYLSVLEHNLSIYEKHERTKAA